MINVSGLIKDYGSIRAVDNVSFDVPKGSVFAFLGPNGAGKTTLIKMLTTILRPTGGTMRVNGHDPVTDPDDVRRAFGIVFQDPSHDEQLTAYENMDLHGVLYAVPSAERKMKIKELLQFVDLWGRQGDIVKNFSGGMKRRLEIARALLHEPRVLFLDEPTLGLDPQTRHHMWAYIKGLNKDKGVTIFFTTHYMDEAERIAQDVAVIDHGKIVARGAPSEIIKQAGAVSLEDAFIALTGHDIREEEGSSSDRMRLKRAFWRRR